MNLLPGPDCLYLVLEHCEGGDLAQKIKHKIQAADTFSENEVRYGYRFIDLKIVKFTPSSCNIIMMLNFTTNCY